MPLWQWLLDVTGVILVLLLVFAACLIVRRRVLSRHGGTFEVSYRVRSGRAGRGWVLGLGRYSGDRLEWFRIFSLSPRPRRSWRRSHITYTGQRDAQASEQLSLFAEHVIVTVDADGRPLEFAMSPRSLMGFQSWLESAPPGTDWDRDRRL